MRAPPTRFVIESFFVTLDAVPTKKVFGAVRADEFNHVIGESITTLAPLDCFVFRHGVFFLSNHYQASLRRFQNAAV